MGLYRGGGGEGGGSLPKSSLGTRMHEDCVFVCFC